MSRRRTTKIPKFKDEAAEVAFWDRHQGELEKYFDFQHPEPVEYAPPRPLARRNVMSMRLDDLEMGGFRAEARATGQTVAAVVRGTGRMLARKWNVGPVRPGTRRRKAG